MRKLFAPLFVAVFPLALAAPLRADPGPGDVFREYTYGNRFSETDPATKRANLQPEARAAMADRVLDIADLRKAGRVEVVVEYWGGHVGTGGQAFRINGHDWIAIPQPAGTPTPPECYYRTLLKATVQVPPGQLKQGVNRFNFKAGPQTCHGFDWGLYWVYAFTVRVYYDGSRAHPEGGIVSHEDGGRIGDHPRFVVAARSAAAPIQRVDAVANYEDFNWEGDGVFRQWHYVMERGQLKHHVGTAFSPPYAIVWNTEWIPDQDRPVEVAARITDNTGLTFFTPARKLTFRRSGRSVRMYRAADMGENFGSRRGRRKTCRIPIAESLKSARSARLALSTWSAAHDGEIGLNDRKLADRVGVAHNYSFDSLPVPTGWLKTGDNTFYLSSNTGEHAAEVNWPGPVLLVEYAIPAPKAAARGWAVPNATHRMSVEVDPAGCERIAGTPVEIELKTAGLAPVHVADTVTGASVPFQYDEDTLVFLSPAVEEPRRFEVYMSRGGAKPHVPPAFKIADDVEWAGQKSLRVETSTATYLYHKEGAGFAGLLDREGRDWIGYSAEDGPAGRFRGIPNLGKQFAHPGYDGETGAVSRIVSQGPVRIRILSERRDKTWALQWDIYDRQARLTVLKNGAPYWFLYEGTPAGTLDLKDGYFVLSNGERHALGELWTGRLAGPKWAYFASPGSSSLFFVANHQQDLITDQYYPMDGKMTVFGYGRQLTCCGRFLNSAPARFSIGLIPASDMDTARKRIESLTRDVIVRKGEIEARDSGSSSAHPGW